jgi:hypothetical protein
VFCAVALAAALTALPPCASHAEPVQAVAAQGTELVVSLPDGRVLRSADLAGAVLEIDDAGTPRTIRIDAVEREPGTGLWLLLSVRSESGAFEPFCEADTDGRRLAFPLAGRSRPDGRVVADPTRFELVCTSGAQGKWCASATRRGARSTPTTRACAWSAPTTAATARRPRATAR